MWSGGSKKLRNDSSEAFKDLKIFDTLEPKKVETFENNNVKTALLVDISDTDVPDPKLLGSFLDAKKQEFTLVDLFQNIYVTPRHVASKNDLEPDLFDIGPSNTIKPANNDEETTKQISLSGVKEDTVKEKKRTLDEIFDSAVSSRCPKFYFKSTDEHSEDCVDGFATERTVESPTYLYSKPVKVLTPPKCNFNIAPEIKTANISALNDKFNYKPIINNIGKSLLNETETQTTTSANESVNKDWDEDVLRPPIMHFPKPCLLRTNDLKAISNDTFTIESNDNGTYTKNDNKLLDTSNGAYDSVISKVSINNVHTKTAKEIVTPIEAHVTAKDVVNCNIFNIPKVKLESLKKNEYTTKRNVFQSDPVTRYRQAITSSLVDLNKPPIIMKNTQIPVLQSIKKDTKAFNRRRIVKKDSEKIGFTKGPDIYEKSVVLPQIMQRLNERRKCLDVTNNLKKKLVLDRGNNEGLVMTKLSPEVLMEDCNKERLKALKLRTAFENFVVSGHF